MSFNNFCQKCGGELSTGGCPKCTVTITKIDPLIRNVGWECPKCGRGNAPWASLCPCVFTTTSYGTTEATRD